MLNAHMKRALGTITDWETFCKMTEGEYDVPDDSPEHAHLHPDSAGTTATRRRSSMAESTRNAKISALRQVASHTAQEDAKAKASAPSSPVLSKHEEKNKLDTAALPHNGDLPPAQQVHG